MNPDHLEAVTGKENVLRGIGLSATNARKTHCKNGHELSGDNLYVVPDGSRSCRRCHVISQLAYERRKREAMCL